MKALEIKNLRKSYNGNVAVDDISLVIEKGQFYGFLGPNGAGKSTTINCISGIGSFKEGTIELFGHDVNLDYRAARRKVGLAPQEFNVDIFSTAEKIIDYMAGYYGLRKAERKVRVDAVIKQFGLEDHRTKTFKQLSGGQKRRVLLARAMVHDPEFLILDEPTAGVDVELRHELWDHLRRLNKEGKTILLTSHYLEEVELLCDHVAIISKGRIVYKATMKEVTNGNETLEKKYLELTKDEL